MYYSEMSINYSIQLKSDTVFCHLGTTSTGWLVMTGEETGPSYTGIAFNWPQRWVCIAVEKKVILEDELMHTHPPSGLCTVEICFSSTSSVQDRQADPESVEHNHDLIHQRVRVD